MPHLQATHVSKAGEGVVVLGVNLSQRELSQREGDRDELHAFVAEFGVTFPVVLDDEGDVATLYEVRGQPVSVFNDPNGDVETVFSSNSGTPRG
jgi:hypothetical protein